MEINEVMAIHKRYNCDGLTGQGQEMHIVAPDFLHRETLKALEAQQKQIADLENELREERHRHDRYVDFELAEAEELRKLKEKNHRNLLLCNVCRESEPCEFPKRRVWCRKMGRYMPEAGFCSCGERRTDGADG